jgi:hypothetical protein
MDEMADELRTPSRRGTYSRFDVEGGGTGSAIPMPGRRKSGGAGLSSSAVRRSSSGIGLRDQGGGNGMESMAEDIGETY